MKGVMIMNENLVELIEIVKEMSYEELVQFLVMINSLDCERSEEDC